MAWTVCSVWVCSSMTYLLGLFKGVICFCFQPCLRHGVSRVWILVLHNVVTVRASLSTSCLVVAPFSLMLPAVVCALVGLVFVTREMKGWPFILLVAALLFLGGYITFVSRYVNFVCFTVLKFTLNSVII